MIAATDEKNRGECSVFPTICGAARRGGLVKLMSGIFFLETISILAYLGTVIHNNSRGGGGLEEGVSNNKPTLTQKLGRSKDPNRGQPVNRHPRSKTAGLIVEILSNSGIFAAGG